MKVIALLGLLHAAAPYASAWKLSSSSVKGLSTRSLDKSYPNTPPTDVFKIIDTNDDGKISLSELHTASNFGWEDHESSHRARVTLGVSHPFQFIQEFDADGDGALSFGEFVIAFIDLPSKPSKEATHTCASMQTRVDTCKTSEILRCSAYISMAQNICHLDHPNVVQHCITSSPCGSICDCIENAEKAAHGQVSFVLQHPDGRQEQITSLSARVNSTEIGKHQPEKRFFWIFLALAIVEVTIIAMAATIISQNEIASKMGREVKNLNFHVWNSGPAPKCAAYVFWSGSCGAIGSGGARGCSDGGTRLYQNSCKDHFRYGSQACGFLSLGCKSLCYAVNPSGCPCSIVDNWTQQDDVDYPGSDIESLHVAQISDCRNACAASALCLAYVVPPADGKDTQINCYLKSSFGSFKKSDGMTSFLKITSEAKKCPTDLGGSEFGVFDRRETDILDGISTLPTSDLFTRVDENPKFWPFDPHDPRYLVVAQFLVILYRQWINQEQLQQVTYGAVLTAIGARELTPQQNEPVASRANPRWRVNEGWRVANVFRALLYYAGSGNAPVDSFLNNQGTDALATALFPNAIRTLLRANEVTIRNGNLAWAGARSSTTPYPGVNSAHGGSTGLGSTPNNRQLGYYQGGAMGPFSLETAFILATQLAGINFPALAATAAAARRPMFWVNGIIPEVPGTFLTQCLPQYAPGFEYSTDPLRSRRAGFLHQTGSATGDPRAGIYIVIDVDGGRNPDDNAERNVFVFAMHTMDPHSRINVPNDNVLNSPTYTVMTPGVEAQEPGRGPLPTARGQQRFLAHAHAAWVPYNSLRSFMAQDRNANERIAFPGYTQVGEFHLYILSEDTSAWPRSSYVNNDAADPPGRKHDEF